MIFKTSIVLYYIVLVVSQFWLICNLHAPEQNTDLVIGNSVQKHDIYCSFPTVIFSK